MVVTAADEEVPREVQASYGMIYALQRLHGLAFVWLKKISAQSIKHTDAQVLICRALDPPSNPPHASLSMSSLTLTPSPFYTMKHLSPFDLLSCS